MSDTSQSVQISEADARYSALRGRIGAIELLLSMAFAIQHKDREQPMQDMLDTLGSLKEQYSKNANAQASEPASPYLAELLRTGEHAALESFDHILELSLGLLHSLQAADGAQRAAQQAAQGDASQPSQDSPPAAP